MEFVQKPPTDETGAVTVRYKGLAEIQIFITSREATSATMSTFTWKSSRDSSKSIRRLSHDTWAKCLQVSM